MATSTLLVSTATLWFGTARAPKALAGAGFEVSLLTPRNGLAEKSRYVSKIGYLPDKATTSQWVFSFAAMVKAVAPRIVLPCDDVAFRLLSMLVLAPPPALQPDLQRQLAELISESLGDPAHYRTTIDKTLLPPAAQALGVRVPPYAIVSSAAEAEPFAAQHGYPVVLKRSHGFAGQGVAICADRGQLVDAFVRFRSTPMVDVETLPESRFLVQASIPGRSHYHSIGAWKGRFLGGWAAEKLVANPEPTGPATVARNHGGAQMRGFVEKLVQGFGMSGLCGSEFIVDARTGEAYLLELNRRITPGTHRGRTLGVDLCAALHAAMRGEPSPTRSGLDEGEESTYAGFPQEWLRDPDSPYLRTLPVDVPWEEPDLIEAMLALRHRT